MKQWKFIFKIFVISMWMPLTIAAQSPVGNWTTSDDKTGQKRAVIHISESGDILTGTIVKVFPQPGDTGTCAKCPDGFKDKPVIGLQFMWGLKSEGNGVWDDGRILDPKTGKIYKGKVTLEENKLYVRGYMGISALGRTQVWVR